MKMRAMRTSLFALLCALASGCGQPMGTSGAYKPFDPAPVFADGSSARAPVPGTIERGAADRDSQYFTGVKPDGRLLATLPMKVTAELLQRGQERFDIHCAMCHGRDGFGRGIVVLRGFSPPPSFHTDAIRNVPVGHFFYVMTHGKGAMYPAASRVSVEDRWAIAAYIRALQLSQHAQREELPPEVQTRLQEAAHD